MLKTLEDGLSHEAEMERATPDGIVKFRVVTTPLIDPNGKIDSVIETVENLMEQRQSMAMLIQDAERMESLLTINSMTDRPLEDIIPFAVEQSVSITNSKIGYLALLNEEEAMVTLLYRSNAARDACRISDMPAVYPVKEAGLWGEVIRRRKPVITNDYAARALQKRLSGRNVPIIPHLNIPISRATVSSRPSRQQSRMMIHDLQ
jgi:hypothetical protein